MPHPTPSNPPPHQPLQIRSTNDGNIAFLLLIAICSAAALILFSVWASSKLLSPRPRRRPGTAAEGIELGGIPGAGERTAGAEDRAGAGRDKDDGLHAGDGDGDGYAERGGSTETQIDMALPEPPARAYGRDGGEGLHGVSPVEDVEMI
ncbi:hypothetical protein HO173_009053 [Letharia columbiana]|uniref:Uncharacterized protein n=1 Tax=Letharia columbiana TaxID=112416 RepID=A0A8H6L289_9LECA|nr:uncharacterized protein HO173_009053 [Letharia columbiana]KAF6232837.1 hypothetical protein HO173_009053 [Letharia columbiana]